MKAWRDGHYVSLTELLRVLEQLVANFTWMLHLGEVAPGPFAERLETLGSEKRLKTSELLNLLTPDVQIIDGELLGYANPGQELPTVVLRAVDSTSWDVESEGEEVLALIRQAYPDVRDIPA